MEELWTRYAATRSEADRNALVEAHLSDAERFANRIRRRRKMIISREDAEQVGRITCIKAVESFDPTRKANFSTWLTQKIHFALIDECRKGDYVSKDQKRRGVTTEVVRIEDMLRGDGRRELSEEIVDFYEGPSADFERSYAMAV